MTASYTTPRLTISLPCPKKWRLLCMRQDNTHQHLQKRQQSDFIKRSSTKNHQTKLISTLFLPQSTQRAQSFSSLCLLCSLWLSFFTRSTVISLNFYNDRGNDSYPNIYSLQQLMISNISLPDGIRGAEYERKLACCI
jgi:hypothetical protein